MAVETQITGSRLGTGPQTALVESMRLRTSDLISAAPKSGPHLCAVLPYNDWFIINSLKEIIVFVVQVNQWLTWLETAEEEESEGEDY